MIQVKEMLLQKALPQKISPPAVGKQLPDGQRSVLLVPTVCLAGSRTP